MPSIPCGCVDNVMGGGWEGGREERERALAFFIDSVQYMCTFCIMPNRQLPKSIAVHGIN